MKRRIIFLVVLLLLVVITVVADDDPETPFPVVEQCVTNVVPASNDWTYSGTLLMSGYRGIHAIQSDWDTPHVLAFFYIDDVGAPLYGGQLSPDMNWFAVPLGSIVIERSLNRFWTDKGVRVYSLIDDTIYQFRIEDYATDLGYRYYNPTSWTHALTQWVTNDVLISGGMRFELSTEDVSLVPLFVGGYHFFEQVFSPDGERVFSTDYKGIYDPNDPDKLILSEIERVDGVAWQRNSERLIIDHRAEGHYQNEVDYLTLYDRDGNFIEQVFNQNVGGILLDRPFSGRNELAWSYDDRYFAFNYHESYTSPPAQLFLLDFENQVAINTCLAPVSQPVWSPDAMQVAMLLDAPDSLRVVIFDLESWTLHEVARHSRDTNQLGTENVLEPDMIGWRSTDN